MDLVCRVSSRFDGIYARMYVLLLLLLLVVTQTVDKIAETNHVASSLDCPLCFSLWHDYHTRAGRKLRK